MENERTAGEGTGRWADLSFSFYDDDIDGSSERGRVDPRVVLVRSGEVLKESRRAKVSERRRGREGRLRRTDLHG